MARTSYAAPGVYVEEIPSARQPIVAVGTNTVGFIGMFPDRIYYPVPNPDYDPVTAKQALVLAELKKERAAIGAADKPDQEAVADVEARIADATSALQARIDTLKETVTTLTEQLTADKTAQDDATTAATDADAVLAPLNNLTKAQKAEKADEIAQARADASTKRNLLGTATTRYNDRKTARDDAQTELDALTRQLAAPAPQITRPVGTGAVGAPAKPKVPVEKEDDFSDSVPDAGVLTASVTRPYSLATFDTKVAALDTKLVTNFSEYTKLFGPFSAFQVDPDDATIDPSIWTFSPMYPGHHALTQAVNGFFLNGGSRAFIVRIERPDQLEDALAAFESIDELALLAAPGLSKEPDVWELLMTYAEDHENVFSILDSPAVVNDGTTNDLDIEQLSYSSLSNPMPRPSKNAAYYFPHVEVVDPAKQLQDSDPARYVGLKYRGRTYVEPSGYVAGIYARTDEERGVHKAPANCVVRGAIDLKYYVSKAKQELLNPIGVNCIRSMNGAISVWGARTVGGDRNGEWKYINVRRLFLFLQESIDEGTQWTVFEPNDMALWGKIKLNVTAFLTNVWRSGALFGATPDESFYVKCDAETNPPEVRDEGQVITEIGVAIVRPAEFVIFRMTQSTGPLPS